MEQPKKPGAPGARDIADLKARLGLNKGAAGAPTPAAPAPFPGAPAPMPGPAHQAYAPPSRPSAPGIQGYAPQQVPAPMQVPPPMQIPAPVRGPAPVAAPAHDPFAGMRAPAGRQFDLRPVDDGVVAENVRSKGGVAMVVVGLVGILGGGALGAGFGIGVSGRRAFNVANRAAKSVKTELEEMHKTVSQIGTAVALSGQRLQSDKKDSASFDPKLIEDLEKIKLDPRPDTAGLFRVDYFRVDVDTNNLMTYYYDVINLYGEVERHVKRTKADKDSLVSFSAKQGEKAQVNYGIVFGGSSKLVIGNLVEVGTPVCKGGGADCSADQLEGFQIRSNSGSAWSPRKTGGKLDGSLLVPLEKTPLMEAALAGSPEQARAEQYKIRYNNIRSLLVRISQTQKQIKEAIDKASARQDLFTP